MDISTVLTPSELLALEKYALAEDRQKYLETLFACPQKQLLLALKEPYSKEYAKILREKYSINPGIIRQLEKNKMIQKVRDSQEIDQIKQIVEIMKKQKSSFFSVREPVFNTKTSFFNQKDQKESKQQNQINLSKIDIVPREIALQNYFQKLILSDEKNVHNFDLFALRNTPTKTLLNLSLDCKNTIFQKFLTLQHFFDTQFVLQFYLSFYEAMKQRHINFRFDASYFNGCSASLLNNLLEKIPQLKNERYFIDIWFTKNYLNEYGLDQRQQKKLSLSQKERKRKILIESLSEIKQKFSQSIENYLSHQIETQILKLDLSINDPDLQRFISSVSKLRDQIRINHPNTAFQNKLLLIGSSSSSSQFNEQTKFYKMYIEALLKKYNTEEYSQINGKILDYFDANFYNKIKAEVILAKGQNLNQNDRSLTPQQINQIMLKKQLTISQQNPSSFKINDPVSLKIKIKNIDKITVKIYELNLEKHYLQKNQEIDENMQLHYLDPTYQFIYQIKNKNPFKEQIYNLDIPNIPKARGVYVIDFDGSGISSRAVIKKGSIFCLTKVKLSGLSLQFYDEDGKKLQNVSIWLRGQLIKVKNSHILPFGQVQQNLKVTAVIGDYAQQFPITIPAQNYMLKVQTIYNDESFLVGNKAKIILNPQLFLQSKFQTIPINLKLLQNISISVIVSDHQCLNSTISFQNVNFSHSESYTLQIPIHSFVRKISINGKAEIIKYGGTKQQLYFNEEINISFNDQNRQNDSWKDYYLKKVGKQYILQAIGMDGERVPKSKIQVLVKMKWISINKNFHLQTDQNGQINLGTLQYVQTLVVGSKIWNINELAGQRTYQLMSYREGQQIDIPLPFTDYQLKLGTDIVFFETQKKQNLTELLQIDNGFVFIPGLKEGSYYFNVMSLNIMIGITVSKGEDWEETNQIYNKQKSTVTQFLRYSSDYLSFSEAKINKKEDKTTLSLKVIAPVGAKLQSNVKVHVFAYNFIPNLPQQQNQNQSKLANKIQTVFRTKNNSYYNNKKLSEEASYVLNRENEKQFIGNNLQKPHILLNRIKFRDTSQQDEVMQKQKQFQTAITTTTSNSYMQPTNNSNFGWENYTNKLHSASIMPNRLNSHNNFLSLAGLSLSNFKQQTIQVTIPQNYSFVSFILTTSTKKIIRNFHIDHSELITKSMAHAGLKQQKALQNEQTPKLCTISRQIYPISIGESIQVNRNSKWCGISLYNVIQFAKAQSFVLENWISQWPTYKKQMKLHVYNKNVCHQLNSYIKHQDEQFFEEVVRPYISNKLNKTIVDLCLLEDERCQKWVPFQWFDQLNSFQKVLLVQYLAKKGKQKQAIRLAQAMQQKQKKNKVNYNKFQQNFEMMMNAQIKPLPQDLVVDPFCVQINQQAPPPPPPPMMAPMMGNYNQMVPPPPSTLAFGSYSANIPMRGAPVGGGRGGFGGMNCASPRMALPSAMVMSTQRNAQFSSNQLLDNFDSIQQQMQVRQTYTEAFKQVQNTQQFGQVTYSGVKNGKMSQSLVPEAKFWSQLAIHFAKNKNKNNFKNQCFVSESIMYLVNKISFVLACCFLPQSLNADFDISSQHTSLILKANKPFLLFTKQIKPTNFTPKPGILMNHRFYDPLNQFTQEQDGMSVIKQVEQFEVGKQYVLQTIVANTTANSLEVQLLMDLPQGAIPLGSKQYTQVQSYFMQAYTTRSVQICFYFPRPGSYHLHPANLSWNKKVIAQAAHLPEIQVKLVKTIKKMENLQDVVAEGDVDDIVNFISNKNVFDVQVFKPNQILWMLKDKNKFIKITQILREKGYISQVIWVFGIYHQDFKTIKEYFTLKNSADIQKLSLIRAFEYFPYYSSRAHNYQAQTKSKIRNVQFKQTFYNFLFEEVAYQKSTQSQSTAFKLVASYYLILQDRISQVSKIVKSISSENKKQYQIQFDYLECFLDMYEGYPNFTQARKIISLYEKYPVESWASLFTQIKNTLANYDRNVQFEQEQKPISYSTSASIEGEFLRVSIPAQTKVEVYVYSVNLELMFSQSPFTENRQCSSVKPTKVFIFESAQAREQKIKRIQGLKDIIVQVFQCSKSTNMHKVQTLSWTNPRLKTKVNEKKGTIQVFYLNKPLTGCYCKVYSRSGKGQKFYRDGYTDITGTFKYALAQLKAITLFSILSVSQNGGVINKVCPPSQAGQLAN